ncbi:protein kinase [candidate division CSSED10-310 bacterium]|uniref:Protein kinase n=1 Tax=candidate division CSSED10-310 bacterium TaxID=2855610 RepID=A0ABV6YY98_UNCC1
MFSIGDSIGPYRLETTLGRGGMGVVYQAVHESSSHKVALKTITLAQTGFFQGIRREIHALARLKHTGIVRIIDHGSHKGFPWYAMEFLEGVTFRNYLGGKVGEDRSTDKSSRNKTVATNVLEFEHTEKTKPFYSGFERPQPATDVADFMSGEQSHGAPEATPDQGEREIATGQESLSILSQVCDALAYLHGEGIVHKDVKPDNILITTQATPVIIDFGMMVQLYRQFSRDTLSLGLEQAGTIHYMAPEQIRGDQLDARVDLYAVGCILYEFLTGHPPFISPQRRDILLAHLTRECVPPNKLRKNVPDELNDLCLRLLAKDPRQRIGFADSVAAILRRYSPKKRSASNGGISYSYLYRPSFIGRKKQLETLNNCLNTLPEGAGCLALIAGESGVGKTRLLIEFGKYAEKQNIVLFTAECTERSNQPLQPFRHLLLNLADRCKELGQAETQRLFGSELRVISAYQDQLQTVPGFEESPIPVELPVEAAVNRVFQALQRIISLLASQDFTVLIFDDLQWADDLTTSFLSDCLDQHLFRKTPLIIVGAYRLEEKNKGIERLVADAEVVNIQLERMSAPALEILIRDMLAMAHAPEVLSSNLLMLSEGNPFFVAEYLRTAVDQKMLQRDQWGQWQIVLAEKTKLSHQNSDLLPLPGTLRELVTRRLAGLSGPTLALAQMASVVGREMSYLLLHTILSRDEDLFYNAINELFKSHILESISDDSVRFVHHKTQEVIYEQLDQKQRHKFHGLVAATLESTFPHLLESNSEDLGYHWEKAGDLPRAIDYFQIAAAKSRQEYDYESAINHYDHIAELCDSIGSDYKRAEAMLDSGTLTYELGLYDEAEVQLENALKYFRSVSNAISTAQCLMYLGMINLKKNNPIKALQFHSSALDLSRIANNLHQEGIHLNNVGRAIMRLGDYKQALEIFRKALELKKQVKDVYGLGFSFYFLALTHLLADQLPDAEQALQEAYYSWNQVANNDRVMCFYYYGKGILEFSRGSIREAEQLVQTALELSTRLMIRAEKIEHLSTLSRIKAKQDKKSEALHLSRQAISLLQKQKYIEESQQIYLNHHLILKENGDPEATTYLHSAHQNMMAAADSITDEHLKTRYLTSVKVNREIKHHLANQGTSIE